MAERDRYTQRNDERGGRDTESGRAGAFQGDPGATRGGPGGRSEFAGDGGGQGGQGARFGQGGTTGSGGATGSGAMPGQGGGLHDYGQSGASGYGGRGAPVDESWSRGGARGVGTGPMRNRGPKGWQRSDERIHDDVCERLAGEHGIDPSEVTVEVSGGNVVLTGSVPDRGMKYRIEDLVDGCSGVRDVDNRLKVSRGDPGGLLGTGATGPGTRAEARGRMQQTGQERPDAQQAGARGSLLGRLFGFSAGSRLSDFMTRNPHTVSPDDTLATVAQAMKAQDVGAIPVCTGRTLVGMVTDRDIVVRAAAAGKPLERTKVSEVMTIRVHTCHEDEDTESALDKMGDLQVRRIPVVDRSNQLVGIVSLGDFAKRETGDVEDALQDISKPA